MLCCVLFEALLSVKTVLSNFLSFNLLKAKLFAAILASVI